MFETVINLKPKEQWRPGVTIDGLIAEMDKALQFPGVSNAWTMPIKARIDMLSTGIRTPVGVKVIGTDLVEIDKLARQIEQVLKAVPGTSSAYAERGIGGYYLEITPDRAALARYGIMVQDVQDTIATALGGQTVTTTVEGRQRFTVNMRYPRDLRDNPQGDRQRRAGADAGRRRRPARRSRQGRSWRAGRPRSGPRTASLATYIYVDIRDRDLGGYVADAQRAVQASIQFPPGYYVMWSGQYEYLERADGAAEDRRAGDAADHLPAAVPQLPLDHRDHDRHAVAAVRAGRRALADVVARLQPFGRGRRRLHRARRRRRRDRRRDADLPQPGAGGDQGAARSRRPAR